MWINEAAGVLAATQQLDGRGRPIPGQVEIAEGDPRVVRFRLRRQKKIKLAEITEQARLKAMAALVNGRPPANLQAVVDAAAMDIAAITTPAALEAYTPVWSTAL